MKLLKNKAVLIALMGISFNTLLATQRGTTTGSTNPDFTINQQVNMNNLPADITNVELKCMLTCNANFLSLESTLFQAIFYQNSISNSNERQIAAWSTTETITPINGAINVSKSFKIKVDRFPPTSDDSENDRARRHVNGYACAVRLIKNGQPVSYLQDQYEESFQNQNHANTRPPTGIQPLNSKFTTGAAVNNIFNPQAQDGGFRNCER